MSGEKSQVNPEEAKQQQLVTELQLEPTSQPNQPKDKVEQVQA